MRFLIDQNLPVRLVNLITGLGWPADHIKPLALSSASDIEIWALAERWGAVVVSKDSDFIPLAATSNHASLLLLRLGNMPNKPLYDLLRAKLPDAVEQFTAGLRVVEIHP